jgi:mannose-6-phosphate isomerase-like protein (cupin superfamily)
MAAELDGGCRAFGLREGEPFRRGPLSVWRHVGREKGARAISLSALELESGASASWQNGDGDEVLFVAGGEGRVVLGGESHFVRPRTGVFVRPGEVVAIESSGTEPLTLLESRCPDSGPALRFEEAAPAASSDGAARVPSPVVGFEDQETERAGDGRWFRVLVDAKAGCEEVTQFVGFIPPGRAPDHFHEYEEVACILEGTGRFWSGASWAPVAAGTCLYLPRRQPHCLENTGETPLCLYGLFYPAGSPSVRYAPGGATG